MLPWQYNAYHCYSDGALGERFVAERCNLKLVQFRKNCAIVRYLTASLSVQSWELITDRTFSLMYRFSTGNQWLQGGMRPLAGARAEAGTEKL